MASIKENSVKTPSALFSQMSKWKWENTTK
jgi:hypothetical protein